VEAQHRRGRWGARSHAPCTQKRIACAQRSYRRKAERVGERWLWLQVIDYDYRGNVGVILFNLSDKDFEGAHTPPHFFLSLLWGSSNQ
jgi:hypothetical protein